MVLLIIFHSSERGIGSLEPSFYFGSEGVVEINVEYYGMNDYNDSSNSLRKLLIPTGTIKTLTYVEQLVNNKEYHFNFWLK